MNSAVLTLNKILPPAAGGYSVVITNAYGAVTSAPAGLIIVDNPRVVYILDTAAPVGSVVTVPIKMQAVGDEQALKFSLAYDPAVLSNPRISQGADTPLASMTANLTATSSGRFGATLTMPAGTAIPAGSTREIALVEFNVSPTAAGGTVTPVGFADQPVTKSATSTNNAPLTALFAAGSVTLETVPVTARGERLSDGTFQLVINGIPSQNYVIEASTNLTQASWVPVSTNRAGTTGLVHYLDTQATNRGRTFYRARFAP